MKTFEEQVKDAKAKKLQYRFIRDIIFIVLGIVFLSISIYNAKKDNEKNIKNKQISTTIKKTK